MRAFATGQRVRVLKDEDGKAVQGTGIGTVTRVLTDGVRAWIALDDSDVDKVRACPEDCELAGDNRKERRAAERASNEPVPTIDLFGKDHWSTFAYLEVRCVDYGGVPGRDQMRCHTGRHPFLVGRAGDASRYPTRIKGDATLTNHDDWDCASDLEAAGLIANIGTGVNPVFRMTEEGFRVALQLRKHRVAGGKLHDFEPALSRIDTDITATR